MRGLLKARLGVVVVSIGICALLAAGGAWATTFYGEVIHIKKTSLLYDVGCAVQSTCVGVGTDNNTPGLVVNAVTRHVTDVSGTSYLSHIDCPKKDYCIAVGTSTSFGSGAVVEIHSGVPGTPKTVPYYTYGVACDSASSCWVPGARFDKLNGRAVQAVVLHLVDGKVAKVISPDSGASYANYPYLFTAGEAGGSLSCFSGECIIAGKLSDQGPGALFSLKNDKLSLLAKVNDMTAVGGLWCFSTTLCRITGYDSKPEGVFATFHSGKIENVHTYGAYLGPIGCLNADMRCFVFGNKGTYPNIDSVVVKLNANGAFADARVIEPNITGVFCSHTCIAAGSVGQYPNAEGVLFDKFVH